LAIDQLAMFYHCFLTGSHMSPNMPSQPDPDQCALNKNGQLKDTKDLMFHHSPSDKNPIPLLPVDGETGTGTDNEGMARNSLSFDY
jgi:hypothetical protein